MSLQLAGSCVKVILEIRKRETEMKVTRERPSMFGIELYDKHYLILNQQERKQLSAVVSIMEKARERVTDDSYLDLELAGIEGRIADLLEYSKIEL